MASKRRTAAEAFQIPAAVDEFISSGVQLGARSTEKQDNDQLRSQGKGKGTPKRRRQRKVASQNGEASFKRRTSNRREPHDDELGELARLLDKASVQKTVRFHPTIIARLNEYARLRAASGAPSMSFQQIQNEALQLWLDTHTSMD